MTDWYYVFTKMFVFPKSNYFPLYAGFLKLFLAVFSLIYLFWIHHHQVLTLFFNYLIISNTTNSKVNIQGWQFKPQNLPIYLSKRTISICFNKGSLSFLNQICSVKGDNWSQRWTRKSSVKIDLKSLMLLYK